MKLELLPVDQATKNAILRTAQNYSRFLKLKTEILEVNGSTITVRIEQVAKMTDSVFTQKELVEKAKEIFSHLPDGYSIRVRPLVFAGTGIEAVSADWVKNQLKKHGLNQADLCDAFGIDRFAMSKLLNGATGFTRWHKAAFFFYFKCK